MSTVFETWKRGGVRFLAMPTDRGSVIVIDEHGHNYGAYFSRESFEKFADKGQSPPLSIVRIGVISHAALAGDNKEIKQTKAV